MPEKSNELAHFQVCSCGKHGRVVFTDGRTGGEIASKQESAYLLQYVMLVDGFQSINIFPARGLRQIEAEIEGSTLALLEEQVNVYFRKEINTWNTAKLHQHKLNPADFHTVMDKLWHYCF